MEIPHCNICGSTAAKTVHHVADWLLDRPEVRTTFVRCENCDLIYQCPRPSIEEMDIHYPPEYEPYHSYDKKKTSWLMEKAVARGMDNRANALTSRRSKGLLLDVGCAAGDFLHHMEKKYGWQVRGVEISNYAAEEARRKYGLNVVTGTLEQAKFPENSFDAVTLWDVLEHLHDPSRTLQEIYRILRPGGLIALRVPNAGSLDAKIFGPYWSGLDSPRHLYVFDQITVSRLLEQNGFEVIRVASKHGSYPGFVLSFRFWMVAKNVKPGLRDRIAALLYHPVMRVATVPVFFLYSQINKSTQLMVVAKVKK